MTNTDNAGLGSLRRAINDANTNPGADVIQFAIGTGSQTIQPLSALPALTDAVTLDGTTQPGYAGIPLIELDGSKAGLDVHGLRLTGGTSTVRGLIVNRFGGIGVRITSADNTLSQSYIGVNATATTAAGNGGGVFINAANNTIGATVAGHGNIIAGNLGVGIEIASSIATGNRVVGNFVGTNRAAANDLGNAGVGVLVRNGAANTTIGGTVTSFIDFVNIDNPFAPNDGADGQNTIAHNQVGIRIEDLATLGVVVRGNLILQNTDAGVLIAETPGVRIGGERQLLLYENGDLKSINPGNLIQSNGTDGVRMEGAAGANRQASIAGNLLDANARHGIWIDGGRNNTIGGANSEPLGYPQVQPAPDPRPEPITSKTLGNVLTRNGGNGIRIEGGQSEANRILGNVIGGPVLLLPTGNLQAGVWIGDGANQTVIGGGKAVGNLIAGNGFGGIVVTGAATVGTKITGNFIGTSRDGQTKVGNGGTGITIDNAADTAIRTNVVVGSTADGILVQGAETQGTVMTNNLVGLNKANSAGFGNNTGIRIRDGADTTTIGGVNTPDSFQGNIVAGNLGAGIWVSDAFTKNVVIAGNFVGTTKGGATGLGNQTNGVYLSDGVSEARLTDNVVAGNLGTGIWLRETRAITLERNFVGTTSTGKTGLGNTFYGIDVRQSSSVFIQDSNVIAGNGNIGLVVADNSTSILIEGNYIGTTASSQTKLGNGGNGLDVGAASAATVKNNVIAGNAANGLRVYGGTAGMEISANYIGTDPLSSTKLGNQANGVFLEDIIFVSVDQGNVIGNNQANGVLLIGGGTLNVIGNFIGTDQNRKAILSNGGDGVRSFNSFNNDISDNTIRNSGGAGVRVDTGLRNQIDRNSMFNNGVNIALVNGGNLDLPAAIVTLPGFAPNGDRIIRLNNLPPNAEITGTSYYLTPSDMLIGSIGIGGFTNAAGILEIEVNPELFPAGVRLGINYNVIPSTGIGPYNSSPYSNFVQV